VRSCIRINCLNSKTSFLNIVVWNNSCSRWIKSSSNALLFTLNNDSNFKGFLKICDGKIISAIHADYNIKRTDVLLCSVVSAYFYLFTHLKYTELNLQLCINSLCYIFSNLKKNPQNLFPCRLCYKTFTHWLNDVTKK
jgi:hypothetical protein